ncbi:MAG: hypothetical protein ALECFALPRED_005732 [Alectoria fallacina]|uniref:O-methyltransferase C-terminal domain-containing protein n=1 Tax=Alectoria fallacina TaxID=1903189 RepID=A0A8H3EQ17_9LECA|nr:MAG: hypothetical protein ALECFALPRED_005732 [Alectoria fallacina]
MPATRIAELAAQIQENTAKVDQYLQRKDLPPPSFHQDGPVDLKIEDEQVQEAREIALDSSLELHQLLLGPALCLRPVLNGVSLQAIYRYDIASNVPIHGEISFSHLASKCGMSETNLRRIVRFAIAYHRVFQEPRKGYVSHSAASRKLAEDANARAGLGYMFDEVWQAFARTVEARERFRSDEPNQSGWSLSQHTDKPIWEYYASHPDMAKRFAGSMSTFSNGLGLSPSFLTKSYPWSSIGDNGRGTVVDVGGSRGNVSVALAQTHRGLKLIVQDLPDMIRGAKDAVPSDVAGRVEFMEHDFFTPQPVKADLYLFRNIFHNWSDTHVVKILRATIPALEPGARVVANDYLIPEPKTMSPSKEREIRGMDMIMLSLFNARERDYSDWEQIFTEADSRFKDITIWVPEGATLSIIEAVWAG